MTAGTEDPLAQYSLARLAETVQSYDPADPKDQGIAIRVAFDVLPTGEWQWLVWARTPSADALLEEVVRGHLHPTWCSRSAASQNAKLESHASRLDGEAGRRIRLAAPPATARPMAEGVQAMLDSLAQRPPVTGPPRLQLASALRLLDVEVEMGRGDRARAIGDALIANGSFSATDIEFIECRCLAAERRHDEVLELAMTAQFGSLEAIPRGVSKDVARAIWEVVLGSIDGGDEERREALLGVSGHVSSCVLEPRTGSTLHEREVWRLLTLPEQRGSTAGQPLEEAAEASPHESAVAIVDAETGAGSGSWIEFFSEYATTPSGDQQSIQLLEQRLDDGSDEWPLWPQGAADREHLSELIGALADGDLLPKVRGHILSRASESEEPLILATLACSLWRTKAYRVATRDDASAALAAALALGTPDASVAEAARAGIALWEHERSILAFAWALDLALLLEENGEQTREHAARLAGLLHTFAAGEIESGASRISDVELEQLNELLARVGLEPLPGPNAQTISQQTDFAHLNGKRVLIYSLHEHPARMARDKLNSRCVGATVEVRSDKDCSEQLVGQARSADLIIVVTRAAKHAATECIQRHGAKGTVRFAAGTGWSSILTQAAMPIGPV